MRKKGVKKVVICLSLVLVLSCAILVGCTTNTDSSIETSEDVSIEDTGVSSEVINDVLDKVESEVSETTESESSSLDGAVENFDGFKETMESSTEYSKDGSEKN